MDNDKKKMIEELKDLKELLDSGILTEEEFNEQKKEIIALHTSVDSTTSSKDKTELNLQKKEVIPSSNVKEENISQNTENEVLDSKDENNEVTQTQSTRSENKNSSISNKRESWFKRKKKPCSLTEANKLKKETFIYALIPFIVAIAFIVLGGIFSNLQIIFTIIYFVCFFIAIYFGLNYFACQMAIKRMKNLQCSCGTNLINDSSVSWHEVKRQWKNQGKQNYSLEVTLNVSCKCPKCGKENSFKLISAAGGISNRVAIIPYSQVIVDEYFAGQIHAQGGSSVSFKPKGDFVNPYEFNQPLQLNEYASFMQNINNTAIKEGKSDGSRANIHYYQTADEDTKEVKNGPNKLVVIISSVLSVLLIGGGLTAGILTTNTNISKSDKGDTRETGDDGVKFYNFGSYPQTHVSDTSIISALDSLTTTNDRGYYSYNGEEYAKVTASPYQYGTYTDLYGNKQYYEYSDGAHITNSTTEYFKVEPIVWKVLSEGDDTYMLYSNVILDNCVYYDNTYIRTIDGVDIYPNNYEYSTLRAFLNGYSYYGQGSTEVDTYKEKGFLNTAFTTTQISSIQTTTVDNSVSSTGYFTNSYVCNDTNDKVFALSYVDAINSAYGFTDDVSRQCQVTDYAKARGCWWQSSTEYLNNGYYWLRSPFYYYSDGARFVNFGGSIGDYDGVYDTYSGVRPALNIIVD